MLLTTSVILALIVFILHATAGILKAKAGGADDDEPVKRFFTTFFIPDLIYMIGIWVVGTHYLQKYLGEESAWIALGAVSLIAISRSLLKLSKLG